jgi:hypothetical protein
MSFKEVLAELPSLTMGERQLLVRRALELDDPALSPQDEALVEERLAAHHQAPNSSVSLDEMNARLHSRFGNEMAGGISSGSGTGHH